MNSFKGASLLTHKAKETNETAAKVPPWDGQQYVLGGGGGLIGLKVHPTSPSSSAAINIL